jgi:hypothetical protein
MGNILTVSKKKHLRNVCLEVDSLNGLYSSRVRLSVLLNDTVFDKKIFAKNNRVVQKDLRNQGITWSL